MAGALVISLDFELHWGVRHHFAQDHRYMRNVLGARDAVPQLLDLFADFGLAATWAVVGLLLCRNREDRERFDPGLRPSYTLKSFDPYVEAVGADEPSDPLHYASSLVELIAQYPDQEIASHTYSHYFCNAPGQTREQFKADLAAAIAIAAHHKHVISSLVFPRNQRNQSYDDVLTELGITTIRGHPQSTLYESEPTGRLRRRELSGSGHLTLLAKPQPWDDVVEQATGLANIRGTLFLQPWRRWKEPLILSNVQQLLRRAAVRGEIVHLWWHPHNTGGNLPENLRMLRRIAEVFRRLQDSHGLETMNMRDAAERARLMHGAFR